MMCLIIALYVLGFLITLSTASDAATKWLKEHEKEGLYLGPATLAFVVLGLAAGWPLLWAYAVVALCKQRRGSTPPSDRRS